MGKAPVPLLLFGSSRAGAKGKEEPFSSTWPWPRAAVSSVWALLPGNASPPQAGSGLQARGAARLVGQRSSAPSLRAPGRGSSAPLVPAELQGARAATRGALEGGCGKGAALGPPQPRLPGLGSPPKAAPACFLAGRAPQHPPFSPGGQRAEGARGGAAARTTAVNQTGAQDWFPEFGFTSQYRNHVEPSGDTRSTGSVTPIPQRPLVRPEATSVQKILPHLACSVICSLDFIKIKTQRSRRHGRVPTAADSSRSLSGG